LFSVSLSKLVFAGCISQFNLDTEHFVIQNIFAKARHKLCKKQKKQDRQGTYNVILWRVCGTIFAMEMQQRVPFCVVDLHADVNSTKSLSDAMETQEWVPFALLLSYTIFRNDVNNINVRT
jgi:hypothetical protein